MTARATNCSPEFRYDLIHSKVRGHRRVRRRSQFPRVAGLDSRYRPTNPARRGRVIMPLSTRPAHRRPVILQGMEARRLLAQIMVTTLDDSGDGSLRSAITQANAAADHDAIVFAAGLTGTINLASALPNIRTDTDIEGPGADLLTIRRDAGNPYPIIDLGDFGPNMTVHLSGLALANGSWGIAVASTSVVVTATNCRITGNLGGIRNRGRMTLDACTVADNLGSGGIDTADLAS